jgi:hypothetical protein
LVGSKKQGKRAAREVRRAQRRSAVVTWGQFKTLWSAGILLFVALAGLIYWNTRNNFVSIENSIGELKSDTKTAIGDQKTDIGKRIDRLEDRILRLEYPQFSSKAATAGLKPSFREFKSYKAKAESLGIRNPELMPVKLAHGFTIQTEGIFSDGTVYSLSCRFLKIEGDEVSFSLDGHVGTKILNGNVLGFSLKEGSRTPLTKAIESSRRVPQIWIAVLARPTEETVILASGSQMADSSSS